MRSSLLPRLRRAADAFGVLLFTLLFGVFVIQITARFVFNQPLAWTDEAATILYLWVVLWGAAVVCRDKEHVAFDLLYQKAFAPTRRRMALAAAVLVGGLAAWALPGSLDYIWFMRRESTAVMGLPFHWVFLPFSLLLIALVLRYVWRIVRLLGRDWEREL
jgi:TRAP-type C4-dicarboxylate transport system permease small subunit